MLAEITNLNSFIISPLSVRDSVLPPDGNKRWLCLRSSLTARDTCMKAQQLQQKKAFARLLKNTRMSFELYGDLLLF